MTATMQAETFENLDRYQVVDNGRLARLYDTRTDKFVMGPEGRMDMTVRDAHDLREEYRYS